MHDGGEGRGGRSNGLETVEELCTSLLEERVRMAPRTMPGREEGDDSRARPSSGHGSVWL